MPNLIGSGANQVSVNGMLGTLAFQDGDFWLASPLKLLATIAPTGSSFYVDFLNVFSSAYDNYLIVGSGINFTADDGVSIRLAVAGAADIGGNYVANVAFNGAAQSTLASTAAVTSSSSVRTAGKGCNFEIRVLNANDASFHKLIVTQAAWNSTAASTTYTSSEAAHAYVAANAVSGFRLLSTLGASFSATGKIRVYGYANT